MTDYFDSFNVKIKFTLDKKTVNHIISTALDGAICYWADNVTCNKKDVGLYNKYEYPSDFFSDKNSILIHEREENIWSVLTYTELSIGIKEYIISGHIDIINNDWSLNLSKLNDRAVNEIIQYALYGDIIYG